MVYTIFTSAQWAALDDVSFSFNGWVSAGTSSTVSSDDVSYCTNSSYDYDYGGGWKYKLPTCDTHSPAEISVKEPDRIFITTMYQQTTSIGWACDDPEHASNVAACAGVFTAVGLQCQCETLETIFPLATEEMTISLRHAYATLGPSPAGRKSGDSSIAAEDADGNVPLDTVFAAADRDAAGAAPSDVVIKGGAAGGISFTLAQWLGMAGVHLDRANTAEPTDARPGVERKPFYRMTGVQLDVEIDYSNKNLETGKADPTVSRVTAEVVLSPKRGWAGLGALPTVFAVYPSRIVYDGFCLQTKRREVHACTTRDPTATFFHTHMIHGSWNRPPQTRHGASIHYYTNTRYSTFKHSVSRRMHGRNCGPYVTREW